MAQISCLYGLSFNLIMNRIFILSIFALFLFSCTPVVREYKQLKSRETRKTYATGKLPVYSGDSLRHILFPVGGIGTGDILIGGRGDIRELEIFGRADLDELPPYMTFFSLWMQTRQMEEGIPVENPPVVKILEGRLPDDYPNPFGVPRQQLAGMPRFEQARFTGKYPFANIQLVDKQIPLNIQLEVFNPLIPLDPDNSSLPASIFIWHIANPGKEEVEFSVLLSISNPFQPEHDPYSGRSSSGAVRDLDIEGYNGFIFNSTQEAPVSKQGELTVASLPEAQTQSFLVYT